MSSSNEITGVVVDPQGKPLAGVVVSFTSVAGAFAQRFIAVAPLRLDGTTTTDEQGRFRFDAVAGATIADFWAKRDDFAVLHHAVRDQRGDVGTFRLSHGVRASGVVLDAQGSPVPGVGVRVESVHHNDVAAPLAARHAVTDAAGRFVVAPLNPGGYEIKVSEFVGRSGDGKPRRVRLPAAFMPMLHVVTIEQQDHAIEVRAVPHVTVRVRFVDSEGSPLDATDVMFWGELDGQRFIARGLAAVGGSVEALLPRGLADAHAMVSILADEHAVRWRRGEHGSTHNGTTLPLGTLHDEVTDLYVVRYRAPRLLVGAYDANGARVKSCGARVEYATRGGIPAAPAQWISGVRGDVDFFKSGERWASRCLLPDEEFTLTVEADGHQPASQRLQLQEGEVREIDVHLIT